MIYFRKEEALRKLKLYLETSAWNFYFADDAPEYRDITKEFFELVFKGVYDVYISEVVIKELRGASEELQKKLFKLVNKCSPKEFRVTKEAEELAELYIKKRVVPAKKWEDALHVGVATVRDIDVIVSWNFRHLANVNKEQKFHVVNYEQGYKNLIEIRTPMGVMTDES